MRILVDMDEVIYDLVGPWLNMYNMEYGTKICQEDLLSWDMSHIPNIYKFLENPNVYIFGHVIEGSQEVTKKWLELGYEVGVVTSIVHPNAALFKLQWLNTFFPHLKDNVHILTGKTKHWFHADILIDDALHNLRDFKGKGLLMDKPWNREDTRYTRVKNWQEIDIEVLTHMIKVINKDYNYCRELRLEY